MKLLQTKPKATTSPSSDCKIAVNRSLSCKNGFTMLIESKVSQVLTRINFQQCRMLDK